MTEAIQIKVLHLGYMTFYKKELVQTEQENALIGSLRKQRHGSMLQ